jgi:hypothetical protein
LNEEPEALEQGAAIAIHGILSYAAVHEEVAVIDLDSITHLSHSDAALYVAPRFINAFMSSSGTKRQHYSEHLNQRPMKKFKSGPIDAFNDEELEVCSFSSTSKSSQSCSVSCSSSDSL